jgi:pilus assembly protein CpaE
MADLRVLIVESDEFLRQNIRNHVEGLSGVEIAGEAGGPAAAQRVAAQHLPDVILLEVSEPPDEALALAERLRIEQPEAMVLVTTANLRPDFIRRAMRAGAQDLLSRPVEPAQLKTALEHAIKRKLERLRTQAERGRVLAVLGVGGGIGTTTIATNLAVEMMRTAEFAPVLLADFDLDMGSVPCFLDLPPVRTYQDLSPELGALDAEGVRQFLPRHRTGVYMLAGPQGLEDLDAVTPHDVGRVLALCRSAFRTVVVDAGHGFDERRIEVLDRADLILLVTQLNVTSLRSARRAAEVLGRLGYTDERMKLVANRVDRSTWVHLEDVRRSLGQPVAFSIANDYPAAIAAIDSGIPLVEGKRSSRAASSLKAMARTLTMPAGQNGNGSGNGNGNGNGNPNDKGKPAGLRKWLGAGRGTIARRLAARPRPEPSAPAAPAAGPAA